MHLCVGHKIKQKLLISINNNEFMCYKNNFIYLSAYLLKQMQITQRYITDARDMGVGLDMNLCNVSKGNLVRSPGC